MNKTTSLNLRITPAFRAELQALADHRGLKLSSLAHSLLVRALRNEKEAEPQAFVDKELILVPPDSLRKEVERENTHKRKKKGA